jgi:hypothetical protein
VDPRGVGSLRPDLKVRNRSYTDPLESVEANLAANAFLVGKSLLGMRVTDVRAALRQAAGETPWSKIVLCGRRDAALVACLTAAVEPRVTHVAMEDMPQTFRTFFDSTGQPINAASILPGMLRDFGDIADVLAAIAPRKTLIAANRGQLIEWLNR